jgi:hypothetical protein
MLPIFLVEETTVREAGESAIFDVREHSRQNLLLTFGITHAVEHESIGITIYGSQDGLTWTPKPIVSFAPKYYCGTYQLILPRCEVQYLKAVWNVNRWSPGGNRPFFGFYVFVQPARERVAVAGAA